MKKDWRKKTQTNDKRNVKKHTNVTKQCEKRQATHKAHKKKTLKKTQKCANNDKERHIT